MKRSSTPMRNWALVVVASLMIILNAALLVFTILNVAGLGWWAPLIAAAAISSIFLSVMSIKKNDPTWLMLDLVLPN